MTLHFIAIFILLVVFWWLYLFLFLSQKLEGDILDAKASKDQALQELQQQRNQSTELDLRTAELSKELEAAREAYAFPVLQYFSKSDIKLEQFGVELKFSASLLWFHEVINKSCVPSATRTVLYPTCCLSLRLPCCLMGITDCSDSLHFFTLFTVLVVS